MIYSFVFIFSPKFIKRLIHLPASPFQFVTENDSFSIRSVGLLYYSYILIKLIGKLPWNEMSCQKVPGAAVKHRGVGHYQTQLFNIWQQAACRCLQSQWTNMRLHTNITKRQIKHHMYALHVRYHIFFYSLLKLYPKTGYFYVYFLVMS